MRYLLRSIIPVCLLTVMLSGCGEGTVETVSLSGNVTIDDKPLSQGSLTLYADGEAGTAPVIASIIDGKYSAPKVPVGHYKAAFRAGAAEPTPTGPITSEYNPPSTKHVKDPIPEKYHKPALPVDATADNSSLDFKLVSR